MAKLKSPKMEAFAQHYALHNKPSEAYRHAYDTSRMKANSISVKASELLRDGRIKYRVAELHEQATKTADREFGINAKTLLARLQEIDQLDVADILDDDGRVLPVREWPKAWRTSIGGLEVAELKEGDIGVVVKKLKLPDKVRNLQMMGNHVEVGAFEKRVKHDVADNLADRILAARQRARPGQGPARRTGLTDEGSGTGRN